MYIHFGTIVPIKFKDYSGMTIALDSEEII